MGYVVLRTREQVGIVEKVLDYWGAPNITTPGWHLLCDAATLREKGIHVVGDVDSLSRLVVPVRWQALREVVDGDEWHRAQETLLQVLYSELGCRAALELSFTEVNDLTTGS